MVLFVLYCKADLENVGALTLITESNLCINVKNPLSDYEVREKVVINASRFVDQDESAREPPHHFALKWEGQKKPSVATILTDETVIKSALKKLKNKAVMPRALNSQDSGTFIPILIMECRGLEPTTFLPMGGEFTITSTGGKVFEAKDVDLSEGDWADYDDENDGE